MATPFFSIIVPVYNRARYLKTALESVFAQTHKDFDVIVVNDGSTDESEAVAKSFPVRYHFQSNQGRSGARNSGIGLANGTWIAFLDSDDVWFKDKLERQARFIADHPEVVMVHGNVEVIDSGGSPIPGLNRTIRTLWNRSNRLPNTYERWTEDCRCFLSTVVMKKETLRKTGLFDPQFKANEDLDLFLRMAAVGAIGFLRGSPLAYYRMHEDNSGNENLSIGHIGVALKHLELLNNPDFPVNRKLSIRNLYLALSRNYFMLKKNREGRDHFHRAVSIDPSALFNLPNLRLYLLSICKDLFCWC